MSDIPIEFRSVEQIVNYLEHLAGCLRGELREDGHATMRVTRSDAEVVQESAELLRMAIEPSFHLSKGGRNPREIRYSARDVETMVDVILALQRHKNLQRLERYRQTIKASPTGWIHEHAFEAPVDGISSCWCGAIISVSTYASVNARQK